MHIGKYKLSNHISTEELKKSICYIDSYLELINNLFNNIKMYYYMQKCIIYNKK
jgi:hypothetical protein